MFAAVHFVHSIPRPSFSAEIEYDTCEQWEEIVVLSCLVSKSFAMTGGWRVAPGSASSMTPRSICISWTIAAPEDMVFGLLAPVLRRAVTNPAWCRNLIMVIHTRLFESDASAEPGKMRWLMNARNSQDTWTAHTAQAMIDFL
jgi:hypothetical protein